MLITCPHLAWGAVSNPLSKQDGVNISSQAWVNSTKSEGQDIYYRLEVYQTQIHHLPITWLTRRPSDHVFNLDTSAQRMEGQRVSFYFSNSCSPAEPTDDVSARLSRGNVVAKLLEQKFRCIFFSLRSIADHFALPLLPHRSHGCKSIVSLLLSVTGSSILLSPAGFLSLREKSWMYIQVDHKHIYVLAPLSSRHRLLSLLWVFVPVFLFSPSPIPLFLFSCQWTDFFLCRGAAD